MMTSLTRTAWPPRSVFGSIAYNLNTVSCELASGLLAGLTWWSKEFAERSLISCCWPSRCLVPLLPLLNTFRCPHCWNPLLLTPMWSRKQWLTISQRHSSVSNDFLSDVHAPSMQGFRFPLVQHFYKKFQRKIGVKGLHSTSIVHWRIYTSDSSISNHFISTRILSTSLLCESRDIPKYFG